MILRLAGAANWTEACRIAIDLSSLRALSPTAIHLLDELGSRDNTTWHWKRDTANTLRELFAEGRMHDIGGMWEMLAADPAAPATCDGPAENLRTSYIQWMFTGDGDKHPEIAAKLRTAIEGWKRLCDGALRHVASSDPIAASHGNITRGPLEKLREPAPEPEPAAPAGPGLVVIKAMGGNTLTPTGGTARNEFKEIIGATVPLCVTPDLTAARATLAAEFPHCLTAIDTLLNDLSGRPDAVIKWRPTLFVGPPGCAKTTLANRIPIVLGMPEPQRYDVAGSGDNVFAGTPRRWASGEPSVPLEAIRRSGIANVCIILDEAEKGGTARTSGRFSDAVLPFLEGTTARVYPDPYIESCCDLSMVNFLATANDERDLPGPVRDRFR
jgi:hypothetical protein